MSVLVNLCFFVYIAHRKDRARQVLSYEPQTEITKAPTNALSGLTAGIAICEGPVKGGHPGGNTTCVGIILLCPDSKSCAAIRCRLFSAAVDQSLNIEDLIIGLPEFLLKQICLTSFCILFSVKCVHNR